MSDQSTSQESETTSSGSPKAPRAEGDKRSKSRSPRNIKAAARILQKEARKIVRKHAKKMPPKAAEAIREAIDAIDAARESGDIETLEEQAEALDELLHTHASFARKSALRETAENVLIAIIVAFGLRSCLYEPFKIPSGSMMPTLRAGDHIFVNKFSYGVQIPLTNTVVAEDWLSTIERGDVVVFRYPLDESEDYIKRVIGLPGDEIKVEGPDVYVRRAGESGFEQLKRERLEEPCHEDGDPSTIVEDCALYREFIDEHSYTVRYIEGVGQSIDALPRVLKVPEGHLLVMGDNRRMSHDSLQWVTTVEAVSASGLLTNKDLRDLTSEQYFTLRHPQDARENHRPGYDHILYLADHRSDDVSMSLELWREPTLGVDATFDALTKNVGATTTRTFADMIAGDEQLEGAARDHVLEMGSAIERIGVNMDGAVFKQVVWAIPSTKTVMHLQCGKESCKDEAELARRVSSVMANYAEDHQKDARELLEGDPAIRYTQDWRARDLVDERYQELSYRAPKSDPDDATAKSRVRLRAWRDPQEDLDVLIDAALLQLGGQRPGSTNAAEGTAPTRQLDDVGDEAWEVDSGDAYGYVIADRGLPFLVVLECGRERCKRADEGVEMAKRVAEHVPVAAKDRRRMRQFLGDADVGTWIEEPRFSSEKYEWDRLMLLGSRRGGAFAAGLRVYLKPEQGIMAKAEAWSRKLEDPKPDDALGPNAMVADTPQGYEFVFTVPETDVVIRLDCARGLCPDLDTAHRLAERIREKARDPANFIDPEARRPKPFVPRGHVKGRAERIWLPSERFWLKID